METVDRFFGDEALADVTSQVAGQRRYVLEPGGRSGSQVVSLAAVPSDDAPLVDLLVSKIRSDCAGNRYASARAAGRSPDWLEFDPLDDHEPFSGSYPPVLRLWDTGRQFTAEPVARLITDGSLDTTKYTLNFMRDISTRVGQPLLDKGVGRLSDFGRDLAGRLQSDARELLGRYYSTRLAWTS